MIRKIAARLSTWGRNEMTELRLNGRTAIVTGAGGRPSLGRSYALSLAARGASVVVNDIGRDPEVPGYSDTASADTVVQEIRASGGIAVADCHSVATEDGARALIQTAVDAFGGVDILVNNAGAAIDAAFDEITSRDFQKQIDINLLGTIWTCRAAWPHMRARGFGRIINMASSAITGFSHETAYAASKGGVFALTRALAAEGAAFGIKANAVNPGAFTRMVMAALEENSPVYKHAKEQMPAELVAPVIVYLAHEGCPLSGECIEAVGGTVRRIYLAQTPGITDRELTIEKIAARWDEVMAGAAPSVVGHATLNLSEWGFKAYRQTDKPMQ
jgi:NAD(P)-dependent dehydrogenase (short-subunit alcohol dehydrogenase family)